MLFRSGIVTVTRSVGVYGFDWQVTFNSNRADVPMLTTTSAFVAVAETVQGSSVPLSHTVESLTSGDT